MLKKLWIFPVLIFSQTSESLCFNQAGKAYKLDPDYLRAIAYKESKFNTRALARNSDGSLDVGIMQINSNNLEWLKKKFPNISIGKLLYDPCFNIRVGSYVLNENFKKYGRKWIAVRAYNAGGKNNPKRVKIRYLYVRDVSRNYQDIKKGKIKPKRISI